MNPLPASVSSDGRELMVEEATEAMLAQIEPVRGVQTVPLGQSLGRVLAFDVVSPIDVPAHDNAAMDGYALAATDLQASGATTLRVAGTLLAGGPPIGAVAPGDCVRIMTGATLPAGLDTVVPHELCSSEGGKIRVEAGVSRAGDHCRLRGEDLRSGGRALAAGRVLRPADLGLLASLGLADVAVRPRLRVALFSTGDELAEPGTALAAGHIYDSNRYSLAAALQRLGAEVVDLGCVPDVPAAVDAALARALSCADAIVTSGGVSVGDADHMRTALARLGQVSFWKVAMRPGRPFAFGRMPRAEGTSPGWLFALPGNPVAALIGFYVLVRPALLRLGGASPLGLPTLPVRSAEALPKRPGRSEFVRATLEHSPESGWQARPTGPQGAGILSSMTQAQVLLVLGPARGPVAAGEWVDAWVLDGLA